MIYVREERERKIASLPSHICTAAPNGLAWLFSALVFPIPGAHRLAASAGRGWCRRAWVLLSPQFWPPRRFEFESMHSLTWLGSGETEDVHVSRADLVSHILTRYMYMYLVELSQRCFRLLSYMRYTYIDAQFLRQSL